MQKKIAVLLLGALLLLSGGCGRKKKIRVTAPRIGDTETGIASWYGHPYHGRRAANGEIYDMDKLTAAHRTLPFGAWVEVENLANSKTVVLRITDRGPFVDGRIIDVSREAARRLELIGPGISRVQIKIVAPPPDAPVERYAVQIGAFQDRERAESLRRAAEQKFGAARLAPRQAEVTMWRVLVGDEETMESARGLQERLGEEYRMAFIVRLDEPTVPPNE